MDALRTGSLARRHLENGRRTTVEPFFSDFDQLDQTRPYFTRPANLGESFIALKPASY